MAKYFYGEPVSIPRALVENNENHKSHAIKDESVRKSIIGFIKIFMHFVTHERHLAVPKRSEIKRRRKFCGCVKKILSLKIIMYHICLT